MPLPAQTMSWFSRLKDPWVLLLLFLAVLAVSASGCATTSDSESTSERPWDTPKGWENGLPGGMYGQPH